MRLYKHSIQMCFLYIFPYNQPPTQPPTHQPTHQPLLPVYTAGGKDGACVDSKAQAPAAAASATESWHFSLFFLGYFSW